MQDETLTILREHLENQSDYGVYLVERAFEFAKEAHKDHKRYSGEPYFVHLAETAKILADLKMDAPTIAAGLLHDTIEDVGVKPETIEQKFGADVLSLVEGVTKLGHLRYRGVDRYSESLRRLFIATSKDLRVLIIKLADRLHNTRTLRFVPSGKQQRIAKETLEIYAPLAYRLGIRKINRELEENSFPFAYPQEYKRVRDMLNEKESELQKRLDKFHKSLVKGLLKQGIVGFSTQSRIKGFYSLYTKLKNRDWDLEKIFDILAIRVMVNSVEDCYKVLGAVHALWRPLPGRIKDYIAFPKPNGYQSLHTTVFTGDGGIVEIQIRTPEMHHESEFGVAAQFEYKEIERKMKKSENREPFSKRLLSSLVNWKAKSTSGDEANKTSPVPEADSPEWIRHLGELGSSGPEPEFWQRLKDDFFNGRIFVFTPKGDVVDLPTASTPLDFAYAIHSDIGDHMFGAKVNGKLVSIETALNNGDIVSILTRENAHPTMKWLDVAKTAIAKKHIRNALQKMGLFK